LLERSSKAGFPIERAFLDEVVATSEKKRFSLSDDGRRIRANQGHTVEVELGYAPTRPPGVLFHGTPAETVPLVRASGLKKMGRHHVHLSRDVATATTVASRRGRPVVLEVDAAAMERAGHVFYVTPNGVWLTNEVPAAFIVFPK
jgi:putative RNA 2'-phosphotransferase